MKHYKKHTARTATALTLLIAAALGCDTPLEILDQNPVNTDTPQAAAAADQDTATIRAIEAARDTIPPVLVAAGRPDWALVADAILRTAAIVAAYFLSPKPTTYMEHSR